MKNMKTILPALLSIILLSTPSYQGSPYLKVLLTDKGLDYAGSVAADVMATEVAKLQISDFSGQNRGYIVTREYTVTDIKAYNFTKPTADVSLDAGESLTVHFRGAAISLKGNWAYTLDSLVDISDRGEVSATANISISLSVAFSVGPTGRLSLRTTACRSSIEAFKLRSSGGASWFYNLLLKAFKGRIKRKTQEGLCRAATKAIDDSGNEQLATLNLQAAIKEGIVLDYSLTSAPAITGAYIEFPFKGSFVGDSESQSVALARGPTSHMVAISISQELFNSWARVAFKNEELKYDIEVDYIKQHLMNFDEEMFKDCETRVKISPLAPPTIAISNGLLDVSLAIEGHAYASYPSGSRAQILEANVTLTVAADLFVSDGRIRCSLKGVNSASSSNVKMSFIDEAYVEEVIDRGVWFMAPTVNASLYRGIPLPSLYNTHLTDVQVALLPGHISIATNVLYHP